MISTDTKEHPWDWKIARIIELPKMSDRAGNLTFIEEQKAHSLRHQTGLLYLRHSHRRGSGAHAHKELEQFLICLAGSFNVHLDDGRQKKTFHLNRPWQGLYVPPMIWGWEADFDPGSICLVLASRLYDAADYYRDYDQFLKAARFPGAS